MKKANSLAYRGVFIKVYISITLEVKEVTQVGLESTGYGCCRHEV